MVRSWMAPNGAARCSMRVEGAGLTATAPLGEPKRLQGTGLGSAGLAGWRSLVKPPSVPRLVIGLRSREAAANFGSGWAARGRLAIVEGVRGKCDEEVNFKIGCLNMLTRMYQIGGRQHCSKNV